MRLCLIWRMIATCSSTATERLMTFSAQVASTAASLPAPSASSAPLARRTWFDSWLPRALLSLRTADLSLKRPFRIPADA